MIHKVAPERVLDQLGIWTTEGHRIMIGGDPGVGKTAFLSMLLTAVPDSELIITIEDGDEIWLGHPRRNGLRARPMDKFGGLQQGDDGNQGVAPSGSGLFSTWSQLLHSSTSYAPLRKKVAMFTEMRMGLPR